MIPSSSMLNLAFTADTHFFIGLETAVTSAIVSSQRNTKIFNVFIVQDGITVDQQEQLNGHCRKLAECHQLTVDLQWLQIDESHQAMLAPLKHSALYYTQLLLADLLPEIDWVLSIDADILCLKDLSGIESYLEHDALVAGVVDSSIPTLANESSNSDQLNTQNYDLSTPYINAGFCLFHLKLWRQENIAERLINWGKSYGHLSTLHDQAMINWVLADRISYLPAEFNVMFKVLEMSVDDFESPATLHFTGSPKPWNFDLTPRVKNCLKNLRIIRATYAFHHFRSTYLESRDRQQLEKLLLTSRVMLKRISSPLHQHRPRLSCHYYKLANNQKKLKKWHKLRDFYRNHSQSWVKQLKTMILNLEQWQTSNH